MKPHKHKCTQIHARKKKTKINLEKICIRGKKKEKKYEFIMQNARMSSLKISLLFFLWKKRIVVVVVVVAFVFFISITIAIVAVLLLWAWNKSISKMYLQNHCLNILYIHVPHHQLVCYLLEMCIIFRVFSRCCCWNFLLLMLRLILLLMRDIDYTCGYVCLLDVSCAFGVCAGFVCICVYRRNVALNYTHFIGNLNNRFLVFIHFK